MYPLIIEYTVPIFYNPPTVALISVFRTGLILYYYGIPVLTNKYRCLRLIHTGRKTVIKSENNLDRLGGLISL